MGENHLAAIPTAIYGFVLLMAAIDYLILERAIIAKQGPESFLALANVLAALLWPFPDPWIERELEKREE